MSQASTRSATLHREVCRATAAVGLALLVAGCAVGPDFRRPEPPSIDRYTTEPQPKVLAPAAAAEEQEIQVGRKVAAQWWDLYRSKDLEQVLGEAIRESPTLAAARAALAASREQVVAARGPLFPQLDASASGNRRKSTSLPLGSGAAGAISGYSNFYSLGPEVSYALDVFGGTRRGVEEQQALAERQRYELAAAYLTLTGNSVSQAVTIASLRAQIDASREILAEDRQNLDLVTDRFQAGKAAWADVLLATTQLAADRATLPPLEQQLSAARHALSVLAGRLPAEWSPPAFALKDFRLPHDLPLSLPSELVRQRPDILAAEAQLHADSAAVGVATAQLFPRITISGSLTQSAVELSSLFSGPGTAWTIGGALAQPIFHGGTLLAQRKAAIHTYDASLATYRQTVLQAFQQVADTLRALTHDAALVGAERQALETSEASLGIQRASYAAGKSDLLQLLDAERSVQQARLADVRARAQRLQDTAQLFVSLGGGWWNANL